MLTGITGIYIGTFVGLPVTRKLYALLEPKIGRKPLSPVKDIIIQVTSKVTFIAPATALGAFAGISLGKDLKNFVKMGWKMVVITLLVMAGTFIFSAFVARYCGPPEQFKPHEYKTGMCYVMIPRRK